jgi:RNA polymerase sigma-70 factor (ECF subfamily)
MDDDELIAAVAAGDDTALRELFTRHAPWVAARLRVALPPPDVEDVLQETFLAVWKGARAYRPQGTPGAWVWVIARNQAALLLRRRGPVTASLNGTGSLPEIPLAGLPGLDGDVLRLMYIEDRPVAEVAALLGVPAGTVKSRAYRVRRLLRLALGESR